ncbi:carbohydrate kinase [Arachidicoccus ginsenosidivorans]|uniref:Carbohydrate kinase n=1 Tax=Arachidicoccus ginsenosidivorans TaxID=496057 RepID=A0A5B8VP89_9BACT|nr:carbohydrate kinase [Arachidicoccus ginsenosidivorans]QEC72702.1 carbohydrate kinase [Arachidicoccus ginsenosidivorans]
MGKDYFNIVCFGEILWDILPNGAKPGGAPVNVAFHLNQLGQKPAVISRIGNDQRGATLKELMDRKQIATTFLQQDPIYETGVVYAKPDENNNMSYEIKQPVAWDYIESNESQAIITKGSDYFIFGSLAARSPCSHKTLFELLEQANNKVLDINLRAPHYNKSLILDLINRSDIVKLNEDELELVTGWFSKYTDLNDRINQLQDHFKIATLIVTLGAKGAILRQNGKTYVHPGYKVIVEDTVGSGDAFLAAFLTKSIEGDSPAGALNFAAAVGATVAANAGAWVTFTREAVENILLKTVS